jgi:hypothetical protein
VLFAHEDVGPVIAPGVAGNSEIVNDNDEVFPVLHAVIGVTVTVPLVTLVEIVTVIVLVLLPDVIVDPDGTVQLYPVAFATVGTV